VAPLSNRVYELDVSSAAAGVRNVLREAALPCLGLECHAACVVAPCAAAPAGGICVTGGRDDSAASARAYFVELDSLRTTKCQLK